MRTTHKSRQWTLVLVMAFVTFLCSCASRSEKEARQLYEAAQLHFKKGEYEQTITNVTKALQLTNDGKETWTISKPFFNGSVHHLRGQAYDALGKLEEAIADYRTATTRGTKFLSSKGITIDVSPGAKAEWFRTLSLYHNSLGIAYAKAGKYEDALAEFRNAIGVAGSSVNKVGLTDQLVGTVFGGETGKRKEFAKAVGAYYYNVGVMEEKLGRSSSAKEVSKQLDYDKKLVIMLE